MINRRLRHRQRKGGENTFLYPVVIGSMAQRKEGPETEETEGFSRSGIANAGS